MSELVRIRLRIPEGKPGDEVTVDDERAAGLVRAGYAVYANGEPVEGPPVIGFQGVAYGTSSSPETDLPTHDDRKVVWAEYAASLGIDTEGLTKADIMNAVRKTVDES